MWCCLLLALVAVTAASPSKYPQRERPDEAESEKPANAHHGMMMNVANKLVDALASINAGNTKWKQMRGVQHARMIYMNFKKHMGKHKREMKNELGSKDDTPSSQYKKEVKALVQAAWGEIQVSIDDMQKIVQTDRASSIKMDIALKVLGILTKGFAKQIQSHEDMAGEKMGWKNLRELAKTADAAMYGVKSVEAHLPSLPTFKRKVGKDKSTKPAPEVTFERKVGKDKSTTPAPEVEVYPAEEE